jgi:multicomponent Na+:H+ antiporter subunit E
MQEKSVQRTAPVQYQPWVWRGVFVQALLLMSLWLILSGHLDAFHISLGVVSILIILWMNGRLNRVVFFDAEPAEREPLRFEYLPGFIVWLIAEVVIGSLHVAYVVLHPRRPVAPSLLLFRAHLPTMGARVLLGNIITLTPGTVTLDIAGDEFMVHTLTPKSSESIIDGTMPRRILQLYDDVEREVITDVRVTRNLEGL